MSTMNEAWVEKDKKYVWHAMSRYNPNAKPLVATEAEGAWVTDMDGKKYLDGMAGLWSVNIGYGRQELADVAHEQLSKMPFYPLTESHLPAIQLGEKINEWLGDDYIVFFSNSGSEANETAFKIARQYHQQNGDPSRYKFIARYRGYHGNTLGALAATGQSPRKYLYEPLTPGFLHVAPPDSYRCPEHLSLEEYGVESARVIEQTMRWEVSETIAGVIMEPIITGGGVIVPPDNYLQEVRDICDRHGALLIIDEVICGFGRTGKPFGFMNYGIKPDIISMAKGITSSYLPLSATAVRRELFEVFKGTDRYDHFRHVSTFGGHPAACAVAVKNMDLMKEEGLIEHSANMGEKMREEWKADLGSHPNVGDIRGKGLLFGIELVEDKDTKEPVDGEKLDKVIAACKERGLIVGKNGYTATGNENVIALSPPLCITDEDAAFIRQTLKEAFSVIG